MKIARIFLIAVFVVAAFAPMQTQTAQAQGSGCPQWVMEKVPGECLENVYPEPGEDLPYDNSIDPVWKDDRWLLKVHFYTPTEPLVLGMANFNKYRLEIVGVYADQRTLVSPPVDTGDFFDGLYVFTRIVCDQNGVKNPSLVFSVPRQNITWADGTVYNRMPRAMLLTVVNWDEVTGTPCQY